MNRLIAFYPHDLLLYVPQQTKLLLNVGITEHILTC